MMTNAHILFDEMSKKTTIGWNSIIMGYALHGYNRKHRVCIMECGDHTCPLSYVHFQSSLASLIHSFSCLLPKIDF